MSTVKERPLTVHEPHRHSVPPLGPYVRKLWARRTFGIAMARARLRAAHLQTSLGQLWTIINPMLLAGIYFLVFGILLGGRRSDPHYLAQLLGGLFLFYYTRNALTAGARSIIGHAALVTSTTIPRAILPLSANVSSLLTLGPMLVVYAFFHIVGGLPITGALLALPVIVAVQTLFNSGLAMGFAALGIMYRDVQQGLPYFLRIWLYLSPVLYRVDDFIHRIPEGYRWLIHLNPMVSLMGCYQAILLDGRLPRLNDFLILLVWSFVTIVVGGWFFLTREREFAVHF